jgi:hypothetical protein
MTTAVRDLTTKARRGKDSDVVEGAARIGLAARGLLYLLVAFLAAQMAFGSNDQPADKQGALRALADHPLGKAALVVLAIGFGGYALWRLFEAAAGHRSEENDGKRWAKRGGSLAKAGIYATAAATAASTFVGDGGSSKGGNEQSKTMTAEVLSWPAGRLLVGIGGAAIVAGGVYLVVRGLRRKPEEKLATGKMPGWLRPIAGILGLVGYSARGLVVALLGLLLIRSALDHDPNKAQGVDGTLRTIAEQPYGRALLLLAAAGLAAFGLHSFIESRYRRTSS